MTPTREQIAAVVDHTYLQTDASRKEQEKAVAALVNTAHRHSAYAVCVRGGFVEFARGMLERLQSNVKVAAVVGFPVGDDFSTAAVVEECENAIARGADELDMVVKIKLLKAGQFKAFQDDIDAISRAAGTKVLKVIFENAYLSTEEKRLAYQLVKDVFINEYGGEELIRNRFFKTSTGFAKVAKGQAVGATLEDILLMHEIAGPHIGLKAAGGVQSYMEAVKFWQAAGSPALKNEGAIDPLRFRIGSSSLLTALFKE